jgi:hypothetical protein
VKCTICGEPLNNDIDTFGDVGQEMCWACWSDIEYENTWYGMAPHYHNLELTGSFIGSTVFKELPEPNENGEYWIPEYNAWFRPDEEVGGDAGVWRREYK